MCEMFYISKINSLMTTNCVHDLLVIFAQNEKILDKDHKVLIKKYKASYKCLFDIIFKSKAYYFRKLLDIFVQKCTLIIRD